MKKAIYLSIKPKFTKKIETGEKDHEFRKYIPKEEIDTLFVYETVPTCQLKYIIELGKIVEYPDKINELGYGNADFNAGLKQSKYAYEIKEHEEDEHLANELAKYAQYRLEHFLDFHKIFESEVALTGIKDIL